METIIKFLSIGLILVFGISEAAVFAQDELAFPEVALVDSIDESAPTNGTNTISPCASACNQTYYSCLSSCTGGASSPPVESCRSGCRIRLYNCLGACGE